MKKGLVIIFTVVLFSVIATAQKGERPFFQNTELSFELGSGGGEYGLQVKFNHYWTEAQKINLLSGISYSSFWASEKAEGTLTSSSGYTTDNHLRVYSGITGVFFKKMYFSAEGYVGVYHAFTKGSFESEAFEVSRDFRSSAFLADYGSRLGIGYQLKERMGIQLTVNNSWRQVDSSLGPLAGLFAGEPDGKLSVGIGVNYRLY